MTTLKIMPDLPIDLVRYNNDNYHQIIFNETYFIKKIPTVEYNIEVLSALCNLNIEGFNNHKKIFIDENEEYLYLIAAYLDGYKDTLKTIINMSLKDILALFKIMLERLVPAHEQDFNPYDIRYVNYRLDKNNQPVFTDFDVCFYKGECTYKGTDIHFEPKFDFAKQKTLRDNLVIHDKMEILKFLLQSISSSFDKDVYMTNENLYELLKYLYNNLKKKFILPKEVDEYLKDLIVSKMLPKADDYFIENLITPLEKGLELKP